MNSHSIVAAIGVPAALIMGVLAVTTPPPTADVKAEMALAQWLKVRPDADEVFAGKMTAGSSEAPTCDAAIEDFQIGIAEVEAADFSWTPEEVVWAMERLYDRDIPPAASEGREAWASKTNVILLLTTVQAFGPDCRAKLAAAYAPVTE